MGRWGMVEITIRTSRSLRRVSRRLSLQVSVGSRVQRVQDVYLRKQYRRLTLGDRTVVFRIAPGGARCKVEVQSGFLCIVESLIYLPSFPLISQLSDRLTITR